MKKLLSLIVTGLLILYFVPLIHAQIENSIIAKYLGKNRPVGFGSAHIVDRADGDITNDGIDDTVILYFYEVGASRDRSGNRYLTLFKSNDMGKTAPQTIAVGSQETSVFNKVELENVTVILSGKAYSPGDPRCCPSKKITSKFVYKNGQLIKSTETP